jgi:hypothetical protein
VALKFDVVEPAGTVTETGTLSDVLLLVNVTLAGPLVASAEIVTVHVLTAFCPRVVGLHARLETCTGARRLIVAVFVLVPSVAVMVAL